MAALGHNNAPRHRTKMMSYAYSFGSGVTGSGVVCILEAGEGIVYDASRAERLPV